MSDECKDRLIMACVAIAFLAMLALPFAGYIMKEPPDIRPGQLFLPIPRDR